MKDRLSVRGLGVAIGGRLVVRDVDLELGPGDAIAVVGPSGSGKSTLVRTLVGLEPEIAGSLRFGGLELVGASADAWRPLRRRVQLCWQDPLAALNPHLPVVALIDEVRVLNGLPRWRVDSGELHALLKRVALDGSLARRLPGSLSGGQRQRVALARALAAEPAILLADEISSALDRPVAWALIDLLQELRAGGLGLLMVTHDLSLLPGLVDEVIVVGDGEVVERGPVRELLTRPQHPVARALRDAVPRLPHS